MDLDLPKRCLIAFVGLSGSGKSSLVFETIAAESQRLVNETYSAFVQGFMTSLSRPDVDLLQGLTTAIRVDQDPIGVNPRSTVGTVTDGSTILRILFSRIGEPNLGSPRAFSFNIPSLSGTGSVTVEREGQLVEEERDISVIGGMCPKCEGIGEVKDFEPSALVNFSLTLDDGPFLVPGYTKDSWHSKIYRGSGLFDTAKPIADYTERELNLLLRGEPRKVRVDGRNVTYEGLIPRLEKSLLSKERESMQAHILAFVDRAFTFGECPECHGTRLSARARSSKINGTSIDQCYRMQITELLEWVRAIDDPSVSSLRTVLEDNLKGFVDIGLDYLSLERRAATLSGGEAQRVKMIRHLGSALTDVTYVFDEPTIGLHPHDIERLNRLLVHLRDKGNTVLMVEHKPEAIRIADHLVELGPKAGSLGGEIVFEGTLDELANCSTVTARHLNKRVRLKDAERVPTGAIKIRNATSHNLKSVDVDIPTGALVVVTGVAGSGKSSLIHGYLGRQDDAVTVDQRPITGSRRSSPATFTGALEPIRKAFAAANGVSASLFSPNSEGGCPVCKGAGFIFTDLGIAGGVSTRCDACGGTRFRPPVLAYRFGGKNIDELLHMTADDAVSFFSHGSGRLPAAKQIVERLREVGLGYLELGQPLNTLSGGERQRLKLALHMADRGGVYILDEPTIGLHLADVGDMLALLDRLVDSGKSVVVIEHHQAVMAHADWIIDLGPGAGFNGGQIVYEGTPRDLVSTAETLTAKHLARYLTA